MKKNYFFLGLIVIAGLLLRFYHNTDISLWHDEAFSALLIKYSWGEMMHRIALDVHPPMYYIALRIWHYLFSDSLLALRSFSVFFGIGTVIAGYAFAKAAFKNNYAALLTALFVALNPFQIQYATEARMYTFGAFFLMLGAYFLVKALDNQREHIANPAVVKRTFVCHYISFAVSMAVIILTHYYLLFTAAALGGYALLYHFYYYRLDVKKYFWLIFSYALIALSFIPWLKVFLFQYKQVGAGYWIPPMDRWSIPSTLWQMAVTFGVDVSKPTTQILLTVFTLLTVFVIYQFLRKTWSPHKWLTLLVFVAPFAGSILFLILARLKGQSSSVYLVRYFLYASAFYSVILAVWLSQFRLKKLAYVIIAAYTILNIAAFIHYWKQLDIQTKPGMNKAAAFLETNLAPNDKLYVGSSFEFFNLKYYISRMQRTDIPRPLLFSGGQRTIDSMPHFAGTAILTNEDLVPDFRESTQAGDTVWLLWTNGFGGSKPETPGNWEQIGEDGFAEVRPYVGTWVIITQYKVN